ncbi:hypothetical protein K8O93_01275 [Gordonia bronchialis]|uniref:hypothetical protein n=1 Tax=Gordonia bronchialis TaxID=2054 RepID=UPI001CBC159F|nr:hypothetical protein [Gordonia bronchialis]UAK38466.1 hypothetical protein K8O93_01275 [Gordonia bronchialis]
MKGREVDPVEELLASINTAGRLYGLFGIGFGLLAFCFGDSLWGARAYDTAKLVPGAPQSWGALSALFGVMVICGPLLGKRYGWRVSAAGSWLIGVWCYVFAIFFAVDALKRQEAFGLSGAWLFSILGTLAINRGRVGTRLGRLAEHPIHDDIEEW